MSSKISRFIVIRNMIGEMFVFLSRVEIDWGICFEIMMKLRMNVLLIIMFMVVDDWVELMNI